MVEQWSCQEAPCHAKGQGYMSNNMVNERGKCFVVLPSILLFRVPGILILQTSCASYNLMLAFHEKRKVSCCQRPRPDTWITAINEL